MRSTLLRAATAAFFGILFVTACNSDAQVPKIPDDQLKGLVNAPEFPKGLDWLNTDKPITLASLRGKIVLLDFWTYCCINCHHVFPDLKRLEREFAEELVVIGVHSAKFDTEKDTDNIRDAILRHEIEHPVINDADFDVWTEYAARAWPSFVLINPEGKIVGQSSGEGVYEVMKPYITALIGKYGDAIDRKPLVTVREADRRPPSVLAYPTKLAVDPASGLLYVSDTNHNRVLAMKTDGTITAVIGSGDQGFKNGGYGDSQFNRPHGLAVSQGKLYVADTENHGIRVVDLNTKTVSTLAGTGSQARSFSQPGTGTEVALSSPWDITVAKGYVWVAMAGPHQIWRIDPKTAYAEPWAGTGGENIVDGPRRQALLAQPSGITEHGGRLYFADSEVSAVRSVGTTDDATVETITGQGLFEFGDIDGRGPQVRMQHPLGVAYWNGQLIVADTYNNRIKQVDPAAKTSKAFIGSGKEGFADGQGTASSLDEPSGLAVWGDTLWIADTNNHLIRRANLKTGELSTLRLSGLELLEERMPMAFRGETVALPAQNVTAGNGTIKIEVQLPKGHGWSEEAPTRFVVKSAKGSLMFEGKTTVSYGAENLPISIPATFADDTLEIEMYAYYCENVSKSVCLFKRVKYDLPVHVGNSGGKTVTASIQL